METAHISLICTVRDEADNITALLDSMLAQRRLPTEIVINDCGSRDATAEIVQRYVAHDPRVRLVRGGTNIPSGRNNAIRNARHPVIACTDAGLTLDRDWLAHLVGPIERGEADVVGGFFRPAPASLFELTLGATNYRDAGEIDPTRFLPFGKSLAFRREAWECVGGFDEAANHCEDVLFDFALQRAGYRFAFAPEALVYFRPRPSLQAFARQYYLYARGDGRANLWQRRYILRYGVYISAMLILLGTLRRPWLLGVLGLGAVAYSRKPAQRLLRRAPALTVGEKLRGLALIPLIRLVGDVSKMAGYPVGVRQRTEQNTAPGAEALGE